MSDLIDRETAKDKFCERCDIRILSGLKVDACREKSGCALLRLLDKVKTVEAVPVVRCKECVHRVAGFSLNYECELDTGDPYAYGRDANKDEWFCADGKRKVPIFEEEE